MPYSVALVLSEDREPPRVEPRDMGRGEVGLLPLNDDVREIGRSFERRKKWRRAALGLRGRETGLRFAGRAGFRLSEPEQLVNPPARKERRKSNFLQRNEQEKQRKRASKKGRKTLPLLLLEKFKWKLAKLKPSTAISVENWAKIAETRTDREGQNDARSWGDCPNVRIENKGEQLWYKRGDKQRGDGKEEDCLQETGKKKNDRKQDKRSRGRRGRRRRMRQACGKRASK